MQAAPAENFCENVARGGDTLSGRASDTDSEGLLHRTLSYLSAGRSNAPQRSAGLKSKSVFPSETPPPNKPLVFRVAGSIHPFLQYVLFNLGFGLSSVSLEPLLRAFKAAFRTARYTYATGASGLVSCAVSKRKNTWCTTSSAAAASGTNPRAYATSGAPCRS